MDKSGMERTNRHDIANVFSDFYAGLDAATRALSDQAFAVDNHPAECVPEFAHEEPDMALRLLKMG
eukprot:9052195-Pyramimonas_sp.AAC.1